MSVLPSDCPFTAKKYDCVDHALDVSARNTKVVDTMERATTAVAASIEATRMLAGDLDVFF